MDTLWVKLHVYGVQSSEIKAVHTIVLNHHHI